jgi:hypothetical protein
MMPHLRPALPSSLPVLYLMSPMTLYGTPALEAAREFPFSALTGCPVRVLVAEDLYRNTKQWFALWPEVRRQAAYGVFLDVNGWVARGTWAESAELMALGRPVWWFCGGQPTDRFGFGPAGGDWKGRYRRVGLGYGHPCLAARTKPLQALSGDPGTLRGVLNRGDHPRGQRRLP